MEFVSIIKNDVNLLKNSAYSLTLLSNLKV